MQNCLGGQTKLGQEQFCENGWGRCGARRLTAQSYASWHTGLQQCQNDCLWNLWMWGSHRRSQGKGLSSLFPQIMLLLQWLCTHYWAGAEPRRPVLGSPAMGESRIQQQTVPPSPPPPRLSSVLPRLLPLWKASLPWWYSPQLLHSILQAALGTVPVLPTLQEPWTCILPVLKSPGLGSKSAILWLLTWD